MINLTAKERFCEYVGELAVRSMLYEVSASPKPGLVDRFNSGAHEDMDFYTFMASTAALSHILYQCAIEGVNWKGEKDGELLDRLRAVGIEGEKRMFSATKGVNTHKGLLFSLGIITGAAGKIHRETGELFISSNVVCREVQKITKGITGRELEQQNQKKEKTYGERLFQAHGIKGIRGEVEDGFPTVSIYSLPVLRNLMDKEGLSLNDILVQVLLHLMVHTEDSNILGRHDFDTLNYVKRISKDALDAGGMFSEQGKTKIIEMDESFTKRNISPGGSADLLAVTVMLYLLETPKNN